mgnify:CR=1 FL=1
MAADKPHDPAAYEPYAGRKRQFLGIAPWVRRGGPRDELREVASVRVVSKPFTSDELRTAVHEALAGAGPADRGSPEPI